ncbi:MAG: hypothetical protein M3N98_00055, partial [Actinomycetota bacterium]|nr:hypothetical protein [Actinomycetota bacterium]
VVAGADTFLAATAGLPPDQPVATPWYGEGASLTVHQATCLLLGEQIVHGYDMAKAAHRPWPISDHDALLTFAAARAMMPKLADPVAIGATTATFELRLGRAERFVVRVADRAVATEPVAGQAIDCHVLADPVAMLLLGYGRISQWRAIGRAKMITWGRRPWLAFRLPAFFSQP